MQTSAEAVYCASSPPFILDSDMSGSLDADPEFDFFNSNLPIEASNSPGVFLSDDFTAGGSQFLNAFSNTSASTFQSPLPQKASLIGTPLHQRPIRAPLTASPAGSSPGSSSEFSGYKRKSSSESSRSAQTTGDVMMADDGDWKMDDILAGNDMPHFGGFDGTINPASMNTNFDFNDNSMDNDFDFDSAANSPFGIGQADLDPPELAIKRDTPIKNSPGARNKLNRNHKKANSHSLTQNMNGFTASRSREASPLSAIVASHESSPAALFKSSPEPVGGMEFTNGAMFSSGLQNPGWTSGFENYSNNGLPGMQYAMNPQQMPQMGAALPFSNLGPPPKPVLTVHPTPLKSRVETQIPIKLTLYPMPPGVTKLHLPTHTISKPKLLAKPPLERAADTLELYTTLVCSSAMQNPELRRRAFERAAAPPSQKEEDITVKEGEEEREEDKPLNGGDVNICAGCITRERKRAARKKVKKVEEEESWHKEEAKRIIVFNTHELKDWQTPSSQQPSEATGDRPEPFVPDGSMQVDAPMRIACYCRHRNEKVGFQVIFTIKDHQDRLIAQEITSSIMITDDHKTHNMPPLTTQTSSGSDGQYQTFSGEGNLDLGPAPIGNNGPFRLSHSSSDLQGIRGNPNLQFPHNLQPNSPTHPPQINSAIITPRNMSRQTSPSVTAGPTSKKRKASGSGKVPTGLAMTRLETSMGPASSGPPVMSATTSATVSPFTNPGINSFPTEPSFGPPPTTIPHLPQQYNTGPPTPNSNDQIFINNHNRTQSFENLAMGQPMYSAPASAHPSRAPSPSGLRNGVVTYHQQQAHISQAVSNGLYGMPLTLNPHRPPTIHKLIPNEGPKGGGVEVTCLGSGFCQGLEVMFGDAQATTTTFWGETSLVCLLPPSAFAGLVPVTFKHQHQMPSYPPSMPKQQVFFKYVDDDEQQIIRTALSVLGHKMTGKIEDVRDLARRIVGDGYSSLGAPPTGHPPSGGVGNQPSSNFSAATFGIDVEATLLRCLDLIDLDDSPNMPRLNLRRGSGQTMLHLACSLGLNRFVAALLARGANPEPRDKGGFTPMHFAALHNHPQIVRRLMLSGADPNARSQRGLTASDMAISEEVLRVTRRIEHHSRTRSGSSLRSRTNSATSLRSVWEPLSSPASVDNALSDDSDNDNGNEYEDEDADAANDDAFWMRPRPNAQNLKSETSEKEALLNLPGIAETNPASPTAAMTAFRDQLTAQFQHMMHLNLPNLPQMPRFDMANLPDYQAYLGPTAPMVRRISNLVNNRQDGGSGAKEQEYKWWDLFSSNVPAAPPAYEDIFPQDVDTKRESASRAAADAVADNKCMEIFDQDESATSSQKTSVKLDTVRIGSQYTVTREQQDQLRLAHAEKVKRLSRDRNLFFIWIPLLIIIIIAMLYNRVPQAWTQVSSTIESIRIRNSQTRFVEVQ